MAKCIINIDFYGKFGVTTIKEDKLTFESPVYIRLGQEQIRRRGKSDPRNKSLMKIFNLINIGDMQEAVCLIFVMYGRMMTRRNH